MRVFNLLLNLANRIKTFITSASGRLATLETWQTATKDYLTTTYHDSNGWNGWDLNSGRRIRYYSNNVSVSITNAIQNTYYGNTIMNISSLGFASIQTVLVTGQLSGSYFGTKVESFSTSQLIVSHRSSASATGTMRLMILIIGTK